ncbi:Response regulator receiver protein (modular protein) [Verrucomicrobia bacterium]|nr:Response regulator receiver protein (modular protein) [Verrucomicrobiota bacterium]
MKTVLLVDDDPNDVFLLRHAMKKAGVPNPLQVATDGQQAIDYLQGAGKFADREKFPFPCLMLTDLKLPHVMGLDVLKWVRQESGRVLVVVLLTASAESRDIAAAYRLGANGFLVKPSQANQLVEMVKAIRDFWLTFNTLPQEPYPEGAGAPAHWCRIDPGVEGSPATNGGRRTSGPRMSRQAKRSL